MEAKTIYKVNREAEDKLKRRYSIDDVYKFIDRNVFTNATKFSLMEFFETISQMFSTAPASTKYHCSYIGGLLDHTMLVTIKAIEVAKVFEKTLPLYIDSVVKCALLHDVGKIGSQTEPMYAINPDESKRHTEPFIHNDKLVQMPHEVYSIKWCLENNILLSDEEFQAILYHNMLYVDGTMSALKNKESALTLIVHTADNLTCKILEK